MPQNEKNIMSEGECTSLTKANMKSCSLRTTVPKGIVSHFDLKECDHLYWMIKPNQKGDGLIIIVKPKKAECATKGKHKR